MAKNKNDYIKKFSEAQKEYLECKSANSWQQMFLCCQKMCEITLANYARSHKLHFESDIFAEYALEAAIRIMNRFKKPKGYKVDYLRTVCRWSLIDVLYNKKQQFADSICYGWEQERLQEEAEIDARFNED